MSIRYAMLHAAEGLRRKKKKEEKKEEKGAFSRPFSSPPSALSALAYACSHAVSRTFLSIVVSLLEEVFPNLVDDRCLKFARSFLGRRWTIGNRDFDHLPFFSRR